MKHDKLFIIRKYVRASSVAAAIRKDKQAPVDDCYLDDDWRRNEKDRLADAMGFVIPKGK